MSSPFQEIDIGFLPNDGKGNPLRVAFDKINKNFANIVTATPVGPAGAIQFHDADTFAFKGDANLVYNVDTNALDIGIDIIPLSNNTLSIGSSSNVVGNLYLGSTALNIGNVAVTETDGTLIFNTGPNNANIVVNSITATSINLGNTVSGSLSVTTTTDQPNQSVVRTDATNFVAGNFEITSIQTDTRTSQTVKLAITTTPDKTSANYTAYGTVFVGTPLTRYTVDVVSGNVVISVSPFLNQTILHKITYQINN